MSSTGIAVGLNKGFPVNKKQVAPRIASRKGVSANRKILASYQQPSEQHSSQSVC